MANVNTLPEILIPLMSAPSIKLQRCAICGRYEPLNQHHIVRRGAGKYFVNGVEMPKPTITLCGFGNNLKDADGHMFCHGLAHANMLHFRWVKFTKQYRSFGSYKFYEIPGCGHIEYLLLDEPTDYQTALGMDGWKPLRKWRV